MTIRIIAEAGINHNGSLPCARQMVMVASECGADTIKFQHIDPMHFKPDLEWQGYNMRELFEKVRFDRGDWRFLMEACRATEINFLCTPQTVGDFEDLLDLGIKEVKISSDNLSNRLIMQAIKDSGVSVLYSSGMASDIEYHTARIMFPDGIHLICTSEYPCPPDSANILRISVGEGFSDHTQGATAAVMALALGATVFEKHFTLDHSMEGPDHSWSADPEELKEYVDTLRTAEKMLGSGEFKPTEKELELKKLLEA